MNADAVLFKPQTAYRVRWNTNTDTPLPPDEPTAPNPPEGAIIDYYLKTPVPGPVTLEITDSAGRLVRQYSSADPVVRPDPVNGNLPLYWFRPPTVLSTSTGFHRFTWDVHYQPLGGGGGGRGGLPIAAVPYNTIPAPTAPWVSPGAYTVKLTINGKSYTQPIAVKQDPRVKTPTVVMQRIYSLTRSAYMSAADAQKGAMEAQSLRDEIARMKGQTTGATATALAEFDKKIASAFDPGTAGRAAAVMNTLQSADVQPTALQARTIETALTNVRAALARWNTLKTTELTALNARLKAAGLPALGRSM